jgi:hypothetical protein
MRKLVHLCYGVLHTQQPYDRNYSPIKELKGLTRKKVTTNHLLSIY